MYHKFELAGYVVEPDIYCATECAGDVFINTKPYPCVLGLVGEITRYLRSFDESANIKYYMDTKKRLGHSIEIINNCNIRIYYMNTECTLEEAENCLACALDGRFYVDKDLIGYSEYTITGYVVNDCIIGNHDLVAEINAHLHQYMIFVMEFRD